MPRIEFGPCYSKRGAKWFKITRAVQCREDASFARHECQGVEGHKGVHWCFTPRGDFLYADNKNDSTENGEEGSVPPGHESYRTPEEMVGHAFTAHRTTEEVVDPVKIAELEAGKYEMGASISRPIDPEKDPELFDRLAKRAEECLKDRRSGKPDIGTGAEPGEWSDKSIGECMVEGAAAELVDGIKHAISLITEWTDRMERHGESPASQDILELKHHLMGCITGPDGRAMKGKDD